MGKLISLFFPLILIVLGFQFARDYFGTSEKEKKQQLEEMVASGETALAILDSVYTEKTIKIARIPVKTYEVGYTFSVDEKTYSGIQKLEAPPEIPVVNVTYLPSDPSVNSVDPAEELASLDSSKGKLSTLLLGIGMMLVGGLLGLYRLGKSSRPASEA